MSGRSWITCSPASTTKTNSPASSKTTTSRGQRPNSLGAVPGSGGHHYLAPGLRFFHQGQFDGARVRVPTHLGRSPIDPVDQEVADFYARMLQVLKTGAFRDGAWSQIQSTPAWSGNWTSDGFVAYAWAGEDGSRYVVVNSADNQGQCRLPLPFPEFGGKPARLTDLEGTEVDDRYGGELVDSGLYIDHAPWHYKVFELQVIEK